MNVSNWSAPFLTNDQERDILYGNAVRFLRPDQIERGGNSF